MKFALFGVEEPRVHAMQAWLTLGKATVYEI